MKEMKQLSLRLTKEEHDRIRRLAEGEGKSMTDFVKDSTLSAGCSILQLKMDLEEVKNMLSNLLLGERLISARMDGMFRNLAMRVTEKDMSRYSKEEADGMLRKVEASLGRCNERAVEATVAMYGSEGPDPLYLEDFAKKLEESDF